MPDQRISLTEIEVAYLLKIVRNDIVRAGEWGDGGVNLICHNFLSNIHARNQAASPASSPSTQPAAPDA